jgi:hypothetical protein
MTLLVNIYHHSLGLRHHACEYLTGFSKGLRRHGIEAQELRIGQAQPCDLAVTWGVRYKTREMASGRRALVLERGYVGDRFYWTSIGYGGLNGFADFCNNGMPGDRWQKHFASLMQPWRGHAGEYVLIAAQVPNDASLRGMDNERWCRGVQLFLEGRGIEARIRWHPASPRGRMAPPRPLAEDLAGARWLVTYNSNSAVDAVLAGVPAVTCDMGSVAWDVTGHEPAHAPPMPDRTQWAHDIAYAQWSLDEIRNGEAWAHLAIGMDGKQAAE